MVQSSSGYIQTQLIFTIISSENGPDVDGERKIKHVSAWADVVPFL